MYDVFNEMKAFSSFVKLTYIAAIFSNTPCCYMIGNYYKKNPLQLHENVAELYASKYNYRKSYFFKKISEGNFFS